MPYLYMGKMDGFDEFDIRVGEFFFYVCLNPGESGVHYGEISAGHVIRTGKDDIELYESTADYVARLDELSASAASVVVPPIILRKLNGRRYRVIPGADLFYVTRHQSGSNWQYRCGRVTNGIGANTNKDNLEIYSDESEYLDRLAELGLSVDDEEDLQ